MIRQLVTPTPDPLQLANVLWPHVHFYDKQVEVIYSVWNNDETYVPAGNKLGKDFVAGFLVLAFFLTRKPCRIVTTSAKDDHLRVLWGEIHNFIATSAVPLDANRGGPLLVNQREIKRLWRNRVDPISYVKGMVASSDTLAAMQGHHATDVERARRQVAEFGRDKVNFGDYGDGVPRTLFVADECSSVPHDYYRMARTWAQRVLAIGNCWPCNNFFYHAVKGRAGTDDQGGDIRRTTGKGYYRRVIRIRAQDSPNVRQGEQQKQQGIEPDNRMLVPGVKSYAEYVRDRATLTADEQCVSLDADFYEGEEVRLFPPEWLNRAEQIAAKLPSMRSAVTIGCDPAEGGDKSAWAVIDERGLIDLVSVQTPDTTQVVGRTLELMKRYDVESRNVLFDRGGGGKEHADQLRKQGYNVRTVAFGESALAPDHERFKRGSKTRQKRIDHAEEAYAYRNRRAEMYGLLRQLLDPAITPEGFGIPYKYGELRRQLAPIPRQWDSEGRLVLPPKNKRTKDSKELTLVELIGHSPDEADALVLAVYGMVRKGSKRQLEPMF